MTLKNSPRKNKLPGARAQALVEFSIALPLLIVMLVGIMEVGRMIVTYALVNNASRDAVRYASAVGIGDDGFYKYKNCKGISDIAKASALVVSPTVSIDYYNTSGASAGSCTPLTSTAASISVDSGYRVKVTVSATYKPVITLIPFGQKTFTATSTRTILGIYELANP